MRLVTVVYYKAGLLTYYYACASCMMEIRNLNLEPVKSDTGCKRFAAALIFTQIVVLPWRYVAVMGTANSLHASESNSV